MNTEQSADEVIKEESGTIMYRERIEDSPIYIVGNEQNGFFGIVGIHRITEIEKDIESVRAKLKTDNWDVLLTIISVIVERTIEQMAKVTKMINKPNEQE